MTQQFYCVMIPPLIIVPGTIWPLLPPGIHEATIQEVFASFATNPHRLILFNGLKKGLDHLFSLGCPKAYLDGSYVTGKPKPNDYEVVWDVSYVDPGRIDPVFIDFTMGTTFQKAKYSGEYFPSISTERSSGKTFIEFFQIDKMSGKEKGILRIVNYLKGGGTI
ncbi:DUF6932 family protein [Chitinophaga barathri]|nr:hypothetical protein [Chitinophaga barathri]